MGFIGTLPTAFGANDVNASRSTYDAAGGSAQSDFADAIRRGQQNALGGNDAASATGQRQGSFADMMQAQAEGRGPSVAGQMLTNATDANAKQAAGAVASQRGLNPALAQRLALNQAAGMNQQAAGQAANLRAEEMLAGRTLYGSALQSQRSQDIGQMGANTALAGTMAGQQNAQNSGQIQAQGINAQTAALNAQLAQQAEQGNANRRAGAQQQAGESVQNLGGTLMKAAAVMAHGGLVPVVVSPGEEVVPPGKAKGGVVPGKAKVPGDSLKNDTVPLKVPPGTVVVPRTAAADPERARKFVEAVQRKGQGPAKEKGGLKDLASIKARLESLEARVGGGKACGGEV